MTASHYTPTQPVLVAVDISKLKHEALVELPDGRRRRMTVRNQRADFQQFAEHLRSLGGTCRIAPEPTADYHRGLACFLLSEGFELRLASSLAAARTREALHNSWDKNDPAQARLQERGAGGLPLRALQVVVRGAAGGGAAAGAGAGDDGAQDRGRHPGRMEERRKLRGRRSDEASRVSRGGRPAVPPLAGHAP